MSKTASHPLRPLVIACLGMVTLGAVAATLPYGGQAARAGVVYSDDFERATIGPRLKRIGRPKVQRQIQRKGRRSLRTPKAPGAQRVVRRFPTAKQVRIDVWYRRTRLGRHGILRLHRNRVELVDNGRRLYLVVRGRSRPVGRPHRSLGRWVHVALILDGAGKRILIGRNRKKAGAVRSVLRAETVASIGTSDGRRGPAFYDSLKVTTGVRATPPPAPGRPTSPTPPGNGGGTGASGSRDLPGWRNIFYDEFDVAVPEGRWSGCDNSSGQCSGLPPAVRAKWYAYPSDATDTSGRGNYSPSEVNSIANSMLRLRMRNEAGRIKVSAPIPRLPASDSVKNSLRYGRYEVRYRADATPGFKIAWLLWPQSGRWPEGGEIDFPEGGLDGEMGAFMHRAGASDGSDQDAYNTGVAVASGWHTTVIEWLPNSVRFILDGRVVGTSTRRVPNVPMFFVLQSETALGGPGPSPGAEANIYIDHVGIWTPAG